MLVLDRLCSTYAERRRNIVPDLAIVEGPPLPAAVLPAEALDDLYTPRMAAHIGRAVEDDGVDYDD